MKQLAIIAIVLFTVVGAIQAQNNRPGDARVNPRVSGQAAEPVTATVTEEVADAMKVAGKDYKSKNGQVRVGFERNRSPKDKVNPKTTEISEAMCLTREEVKSQKVENEIVIADGAKAVQILPGGVIDANVLLNSGEFKFMNMTKRKPVSLSTTTNQAIQSSVTANSRAGNDITDELRSKVHQLTRPSNMRGMPNLYSTSDVSVSILEETMGLNIGASFFYMGIKADNKFKFSSSKFRYMYLYQFEQVFLPVIANSITSPGDLFTEETPMKNNWLYIQEVKYGRRLYVLMESEIDLEKYSNELNGKASWGVVSAALKTKVKGSSLSSLTNIRVYTQGGAPVAITDKSKIQEEIDKYFDRPYNQLDIVPLSYKLTYMDGELASLVSDAFLNGKNCLETEKVRIRLKSIECKNIDDNKNNEEIYGSVKINLFNTNNKMVAIDGKLELPPLTNTGAFSFGSKDVPLNFGKGMTKQYDINEQGKYLDVYISNLDIKFEVIPFVHEKDNGFNTDDDYTTENRLRKPLRQMLLEGTTSQTFEFRRKGSVLLLNFEIVPM